MVPRGVPPSTDSGSVNAFAPQDHPDRAATVYIAGPMTGIAELNRPAFEAAAAYLASLNRWRVVRTPFDASVATGDVTAPLGYGDYLRADLQQLLCEAGSLVLLPGWGRSRGALLEAHIAGTLGLDLYFLASDARDLVAMG